MSFKKLTEVQLNSIKPRFLFNKCKEEYHTSMLWKCTPALLKLRNFKQQRKITENSSLASLLHI